MSSSGGLATTLPSLTLTGALRLPARVVAGDIAMDGNDFLVECNAVAAARVVTLPVAPPTGRLCAVKKIDASANTVTVTPAAGLIDGAATQVLTAQNHGVFIQYDGASWVTVAEIATTIL